MADVRQRRRHFARRRRDLLLDCVAGVVLALLVMSITAGLGIVLLLLIPAVAGLVASVLVRRGVPQRLVAAWRSWAWARVEARMRATPQPGDGPLWEEVAGAFPHEQPRRPATARLGRR